MDRTAQRINTTTKSASDPKRGRGKRKRTTARVPKVRRGYVPRQRNALYEMALAFKRNQPQATAAAAWAHLITIAATGAHDVVLAHDPVSDVIEYRPDAGRFEVRQVKRRSFEQQWYRLSATFNQ